MSSSPEMTPMMDPRTQAKMAPLYTIDQILGHNTPGEQRIHQDQDPLPSPNIKGESLRIFTEMRNFCFCFFSLNSIKLEKQM